MGLADELGEHPQDFRLKFVHYKIGHRVTIMSGASAARLRVVSRGLVVSGSRVIR